MAAAAGLNLRVMFQDEARFGRMSLPYRCWAPKPQRPKIQIQLVREFVYVYAAICPRDGALTWMQADKMNTANMSAFVAKISAQFPGDHVLLVLDGASSHKANALVLPANVQTCVLPPYSPELNPVEHYWDELREKWFANRAFNSLPAVCDRLEEARLDSVQHPEKLVSLAGWPWILKSF